MAFSRGAEHSRLLQISSPFVCQRLQWWCLLPGLALAPHTWCAVPVAALPVRMAGVCTDCSGRLARGPGSLPSSSTCGTGEPADPSLELCPATATNPLPGAQGNLLRMWSGSTRCRVTESWSCSCQARATHLQRILIGFFCQSCWKLPLPLWNTVFRGVARFR